MGHRRNRKRDRRADSQPVRDRPRRRDRGPHDLPGFPPAFGEAPPLAVPLATCGNCREFIEHELVGRGECLHPGSGILSPWPDTPACAFHTPSGRR